MPSERTDPLTCPDCGPSSGLIAQENSSALSCPACGRRFEKAGLVLDLRPKEISELTRATVGQFGASWSSHEYLAPYQEKQFLDWIAPVKAEDLAGRVVLDAGCGKGRHSFVIAGYRPLRLYSVDLSEAVFLSAEYTKAFPSTVPIRADLHKLPLASASVEVVMCLGVLHHLADPKEGLAELWRVLVPGGTLCLWVYGREGNGWIVHIVDPIRKSFTSRLPLAWLRPIALPLSFFLYLILKLIYGPATDCGARVVEWLPYSSYLGYISRFPFREIEHIVLDHLCPPVANYLPRAQLEAWFSGLNPAQLRFRWHNRNSWNVVATKGAPA